MGVKVVDLWTAIQRRDDWSTACFTDGVHLSAEGRKVVVAEILKCRTRTGYLPGAGTRTGTAARVPGTAKTTPVRLPQLGTAWVRLGYGMVEQRRGDFDLALSSTSTSTLIFDFDPEITLVFDFDPRLRLRPRDHPRLRLRPTASEYDNCHVGSLLCSHRSSSSIPNVPSSATDAPLHHKPMISHSKSTALCVGVDVDDDGSGGGGVEEVWIILYHQNSTLFAEISQLKEAVTIAF
ncbi:hypothetical protein TEA_011286 [Camellia sinensis var. sinensis]|uniref:SGNH hydrolase-type esterase domain-containing protein n=1 Tax=Camellia sinensis var. sinensis TaxID=542762 RepID=A0A4S4DYW8_CAMSN|nr:hypothetical protein TEA_011286 [Camellia sinensis var. sinensis]